MRGLIVFGIAVEWIVGFIFKFSLVITKVFSDNRNEISREYNKGRKIEEFSILLVTFNVFSLHWNNERDNEEKTRLTNDKTSNKTKWKMMATTTETGRENKGNMRELRNEDIAIT